MVVGKTLIVDCYFSMTRFFTFSISRLEYLKKLKATSSQIEMLYLNNYPREDEAAEVFEQFESELGENYQLTYEDAEAIVYWIYHVYRTKAKRRQITFDVLESLKNLFEVNQLAFSQDILFLKDKVDINVVNTINDFCEEMDGIQEKDCTAFYRGHTSVEYQLLPSVMRRSQWLQHEHDMYNEIKIECSDDFSRCHSHLDCLVEMQHYGLPTRLLDVTKNPLVALYFACESKENEAGEIIVFNVKNTAIKYSGSDKVSILASLPGLSYEDKQEMKRLIKDSNVNNDEFNSRSNHLLQEVKMEKPAFLDIINKNDLAEAVFVLPEKKNQRIIKQAGAFIICGLFDESDNPIHKFRCKRESKLQVYLIPAKAKKRVMKQLDMFSITKATLFPEIEEVAKYIKEKY